MKYGKDLHPAAKIELLNMLMKEFNLSPAEVIKIIDMNPEEWNSWIKAQNSKLVKVLK